MRIGLTGGFGTGKSTVAAMFAEAGAAVIDADAVVRRLLDTNQKCRKKVAKIFPGVILSKGDIDRAQLAKTVFQHPRILKKLTDILYPEAFKEVKKHISLYRRTPLVVLDVPLLFEAGWECLVDATVVVTATRVQQVQRLQKRTGLSRADICRRMKFQMPLAAKRRLADIVIDNSGTLSHTRRQMHAIIDRLSKRGNLKPLRTNVGAGPKPARTKGRTE